MRAFAAATLIALWCTACATMKQAPTDTRLAEAAQALEEGTKQEEAGHYAEAIPLVERALSLRKAVLGEKHPAVATCLNSLGLLRYRRGDYGGAEPLLKQALEIQQAALGENHPDLAATLYNLATVYASQGLFARVEPLCMRALEIRKAAFGENHPDVALSLNGLASFYYAQGLYARAEPLYVRSLEIRRASFGENHPLVASSLYNLASLYKAQGLYTRAEPLLKHALEIQKALFGENHPYVADSLRSLGSLYYFQGLYARAEPLYVRSLEIQKATLGENHPFVAASLSNLGSLYYSQGFPARAEPLYIRSIEILKAALGENHPDVAKTISNLATFYADQGLYAQAEPLYARALEIQKAAFGEDHPDVATSLNNLAALYAAQGRYALAEPLFARSLEIRKSIFGESHSDVAASLHGFATFYAEQGLFARAEPLFIQSFEIQKAVLGENHINYAISLNAFGRQLLAQQRLDEAVSIFEKTFTVSEHHLRQEVFGFSENHLAEFLHRFRAEEELIYTLARAHPDNERILQLALSAALLRKGRSVREIANTSHIIYRNLEQPDRETFERLRGLRTQLASLSLSGPGPLSAADYQQRLKELTERGDALEEALARRSEPLRRLLLLPPPAQVVSQVAAALPPQSVLIEFVSYQDRPLGSKSGLAPAERGGGARYLALLLFADGHVRAVDLGPAESIDRAALLLHHALADKSTSYLPAAQALHRLAFRPLLSHLGQAQNLFLVPDGQLNLVPFAALHNGRRFLVDDFHLTYLTSGKDLLPSSDAPPTSQSMVILADPDFGTAANAPAPLAQSSSALPERSTSLEGFFTTLRSERVDIPWKPLPGTRLEAEALHRLFPRAKLLLGADASKQALLSVSTPGLLHIATHGFFLEDAAHSQEGRAPGSLSLDGGPQARPADPLLRSGLVLAGAHASAEIPGALHLEDSLVTALELAGLNLWGTQLVVLSACDTGRGDIQLGEGVYGLRRAFRIAGAETVVTSLWKVSDQVTKELMESYYRHLLAGQGRTRALREAMRQLRLQYPHPHFWAAFTALGQDTPLRVPPEADEGKLPHTAQLP